MKNRNIYVTLLAFLLLSNAHAKHDWAVAKIDSIIQMLENKQIGNLAIDSITNLENTVFSDMGSVGILYTNLVKARQQERQEKYHIAYQFYKEALDIGYLDNRPEYMFYVRYRLAWINLNLGNPGKAIKLLQVYTETDYSFLTNEMLIYLYLLLADNFEEAKQYDRALKMGEQALQIAAKAKWTELSAQAYNHIGSIQIRLRDDASALDSYRHALDIYNALGDTLNIAYLYHNIAEAYEIAGKHDSAYRHYMVFESMIHFMPLIEHKAHAFNSIGDFFLQVDSLDKALDYLLTANANAPDQNNLGLKQMISSNLASVYARKNEFGNAYKYEKIAGQIKDSINQRLITSYTYNVVDSYDTNQQLNKIKILRVENSYMYQQRSLYVVLLALVSAILLSLVYFLRKARKSKQFLETVVQSFNHPFYVINPNNYKVELSNQKTENIGENELFCYKQIQGRNQFCQPPEMCSIKRILETKEAQVVEFEKPGEDGVNHYYKVNAFPVFNNKNEVYKVIEYVVDITKEKNNLLLIDKLSKALVYSPASVVITNDKGDIEYVNPKFESVTGYSFKEVVGQNPRVLKSGLQDKDYYTQMWQQLSTGKEWSGEFANKRKDGSLYWEYAYISPILDNHQQLVSYVAIKEDITARKKHEASVAKYNHELKMLNASKDKLFSIIAHDLKNPFNNLLSTSNLIMSNSDNYNKEQIIQLINNINSSARTAYNLVISLLDWARSQSGRIEYQPKPLNLVNIIQDNIQLVTGQAEKKGIQIDYSAKHDYIVEADSNMLNTILRNLLSNAIKFTPQDGRINLIVSEKDQYIYVEVKDNGVGMEAENLQKLFKIGEQKSAPGTMNEQGTGLGLIVTKEFINKMGSTIKVKSKPGKGSSFCFRLPKLEQNEAVETNELFNKPYKNNQKDDKPSEFRIEPEQLKILKAELVTPFKNARRTNSLKEIKSFAELMEKVSTDLNLNGIEKVSTNLNIAINSFDFKTIDTLMEQLHKILIDKT